MPAHKYIAAGLLAVISFYAHCAVTSPPEQAITLSPPSAADIAVIVQRYAQADMPPDAQSIQTLLQAANQYLATETADGSWADIDYNDVGRATWRAADHLQRLLMMAKAASLQRGKSPVSSNLSAAVLRGLRFWYAKDLKNPNWWWNEIGIPQLVGEISALMLPELTQDLIQSAVVVMKRSEWRHVPWTGANLTWGVTIEIIRGCIANDPGAVSEGYARLYEEIRHAPRNEEGIQFDNSFHQHGPQLYNGGYGLTFADDTGRFIAFAWGTSLQIPADRMAIFNTYILDGERWMLRGITIDYSVMGREIVRAGKTAANDDWNGGPISPVGAAYGLRQMASLLAHNNVPRRAEYQAMADALSGRGPIAEPAGDKSFWCSDYLAHRRAGYFTSVKMLSERMINAESVNNEGKKSGHLSDGVNLLYKTGKEYRDIFPVWNWSMLPGTTAVQPAAGTKISAPSGQHGQTVFDGSVSDGTYGLATMDLKQGDLTAQKSWFFFDEGYLAMGTGINDSGNVHGNVITDINQTKLNSPVVTSLEPSTISRGTYSYMLKSPSWFMHDGVGYLFPANTHVGISIADQSGRWSDIGTGSDALVTVPVFNLWIDHGDSPASGTYEYLVMPSASLAQMRRYARSPRIRKLANTPEVQAAWSESANVAELVFRRPGNLATPLGTVQVDHACALLIQRTHKGWKVTASDPAQNSFKLQVSIGTKTKIVDLPDGSEAGSSVTAWISR